MKRVKLHKNNKNLIGELGGETYDKKVNNLIDWVEDFMPFVEVDYAPISSIGLDESTVRRLESFKLTDGESYENILVRMILLAKALNSYVD